MHRGSGFLLGMLVFLFLGQCLSAQQLRCLRNPSPEVLYPRQLSVSVLAGYETGAIPTALLSPRLSYGIIPKLEASGGATLANFVDQDEYRLAKVDLRVQYALLTGELLSLAPYVGAAHSPGDVVSVPYEEGLDTVHTVIAEHGDPGTDLMAGVVGATAPITETPPVRLGYSAEYARTFGRDYYPSFEESSYQNRIRFNLFPFVPLRVGEFPVIVALQNRYTYWSDRGTMLDLLGQATAYIGDRLQLTAGVSIPAMGGNVYKFLIGSSLQIGTSFQREIRVQVRDLHFPPDQAILYGPENEKTKQNERRIRRLYRKLQKYPDYAIVVEGHTSWVYWDDPVRGPEEQRDVLIPLSRARAAAVVEALAELGLSRERMSYVGKGGSDPDVPFDDPEQWKNRRVEVVLIRE